MNDFHEENTQRGGAFCCCIIVLGLLIGGMGIVLTMMKLGFDFFGWAWS